MSATVCKHGVEQSTVSVVTGQQLRTVHTTTRNISDFCFGLATAHRDCLLTTP